MFWIMIIIVLVIKSKFWYYFIYDRNKLAADDVLKAPTINERYFISSIIYSISYKKEDSYRAIWNTKLRQENNYEILSDIVSTERQII